MKSVNKHIILVLVILVTLGCFFGIAKTYPNKPKGILFFVELLTFLYVSIYINFSAKRGVSIIKKWGYIRFLFRMFFVAITVFLIVSVLLQHQVFLSFLDPYYFILLFIFLLEVLTTNLYNSIQLKQEQNRAELMLLRSQLNPHFFFNTLNNLYALTIKNSKEAPQVILKLSEMMRYTIYEGEKSKVSVKEEITYLKNYIDLHKLRYKKQIDITFNSTIDESITVVPLLFINLLENAFKHGIDTVKGSAFIRISLYNDDTFLYFSMENNFEAATNKHPKGIGLKNLQRRLMLLYPKTHVFECTQQDFIFKAYLKIPL